MTVTRAYWRGLGGHWRAWSALLACSLLEALPAFLSGRLVQRAVDDGFAVGRLGVGLAWLAGFAVAAVVGAFGARLVWQRLGVVIEPLRDSLVRLVVGGVLHDPAPPRGGPDAAGVARITQHVEVIRDATAGLLVQARGLVVTVVGALAGVTAMAGELAWLVAVPVVAALAVFVALLPTLARRQRALALADEHTAGTVGGVLTGMRDVVACGARDVAAGEVRAAVRAQAGAAVRMATAAASRTLVIAVGAFLPLVLVLLSAPAAVSHGSLTAGAVLGTLVYLTGTLTPALHSLAATASTVVLRLLVALRRLDEVHPPPPTVGTEKPAHGVITVRALTHRWGEHAEPVLRDLDLDLAPGDHLAVVGPSGIGKSTLAGILTGTLLPTSGEVRLGGVPVTDIDPAHRHRLIAFTPQESYIFAGTVRENLSLLAPTADDRHLQAAADAVGAANLIHRLGGLSALLDHAGAGLSAGERQLLALTRVYASPATIVVLDEATANLDPPTEAQAEHAFATRDGILIVIAHRLTSAIRAPQVLLMDGRETHLGDHPTLLATSPAYAALMHAWAPLANTQRHPHDRELSTGADRPLPRADLRR
ncbi:ATP-binding cassette domain-containing protein [Actinokineospora iranica]|uniref:ATP-binding cassette domain-containing protein n=1 Tax=Actinokineospora iranica TaxID=1271860 RepID=UPI000B862720|nr:ABC transporter ATP-binding protein [Actinokineospora iranica]